MRRLLVLVAVFAALVGGGWKWDAASAAPSHSRLPGGSDCVNGRYYILLPGPQGNGEYYCQDGWLILVHR